MTSDLAISNAARGFPPEEEYKCIAVENQLLAFSDALGRIPPGTRGRGHVMVSSAALVSAYHEWNRDLGAAASGLDFRKRQAARFKKRREQLRNAIAGSQAALHGVVDWALVSTALDALKEILRAAPGHFPYLEEGLLDSERRIGRFV